MISHKYAEFGSARVINDLAENHGRKVARSFVQNVADAVAAVALAKEEDWEYALPELEEPVATITIGHGRDLPADVRGRLAGDDGRHDRLLRRRGERQHTIYMAATPEYGKATFLDRMEREIDRVKAAYPQARYVGLADGAKGNWELPGPAHRDPGGRLLARGRVPLRCGGRPVRPQPRGEGGVAGGELPPAEARAGCGPAVDPKDLKRLAAEKGVPPDHEDVEAAITYFGNQSKAGRMDYPPLVAANVPIGSGVTEAACKVLVKQRLCGSGMKWKEPGAAAVLSVRCLTYTTERWSQFWGKIDRYGFPVAA